ncbi:hypothetical protein DQK91_02960 [Oceanidesulfovibrio marinus]|uniref:Uncharacterized protein n=2 Tax=Oceanidesulfovibrio marinus TaxID=370038 RepID=A0A6P1ZJ58_9BACT|nr:hypothetical protein DQK91_02960 [Oceanidesulfovibrio marinus]
MKADPDSAAIIRSYMNGVMRKDIVTLGVDEAFTLRDETGEIRAFKQKVILSKENGGLVKPGFGDSIPWVVSAQGYTMWAEGAGAVVISPEQVLVDGEWKLNPYIVRDPSNRRILYIVARAIAYRFSSKGIPQVRDWTTMFDVVAYRMIDLLAKAKKNPSVFRLLPSEFGMPEENGTWAGYPFDEFTTLWINTSHDEALKWYAEIMNREKKAIDFAQTFANRNATKHLSGLQKSPYGDYWEVPVICWRPTTGGLVQWSGAQYANLREKVAALGKGDMKALAGNAQDGVVIDIKEGRESVEVEHEVLESEVDPEDLAEEQRFAAELPPQETQPGPQAEPEAASGPLSEEDKRLLRNLQATIEQVPEEYEEACKRLGIQPQGVHSPAQAREIMDIVNDLMGVNEEA